ncbi:hypothetical protein A2Z33_02280 [Candidatus Gottesmanbacteria bacterium RBG_16_52_11]|uniref:Glycosyl transferase family 1 domain-containing protein n=1 Tax=Candidatus Gottesmanbacteria bacterium RBG_16_52_11 TaxID=1798374 RepID=A0A1F5YRT5_9BACT|nr:MAG: hypothetical protein A2Z33_02280 [Candidatus Gottesmanbacteria bacterium RBG_16_52_11]
MKIGMMITPMHPIPPLEAKILAPWLLVSQITEELVRRSRHEVYLFAPQGSVTGARLYDFGMKPVSALKNELSLDEYEERKRTDEADMFRKMIETGKSEGISVYHLHQTVGMAPLIREAPREIQFVITLHDPLEGDQRQAAEELRELPNCRLVSISNAQRQSVSANFTDTVHHGIDAGAYPFSAGPQPVGAVMGRILSKKGQLDAILATKAAGLQCYIVGHPDLRDEAAGEYWYGSILPQIDGIHAVYIPFVRPGMLYPYYQKARALLMPIRWEEPFGLVMIEAMACGTPVVAYNRGSVPEIVRDGVTGFIVDPPESDEPAMQEIHRSRIGSWIIKERGVAGLTAALNRISEISRDDCRKHVEEQFTISKMVDGYEKVYESVAQL